MPRLGIADGDVAVEAHRSAVRGDRLAWPSSVLIGVVFAGLAMGAMILWFPVVDGTHGWNVPPDIWMATDAGRQIWNGALGYVYDTHWAAYALPLGYMVIAPAVGLADHLNLVEGAPLPIPYPTAWLVIGPYVLLFGIVLLHAVRGLARDLGLSRHLWRVQALTAALVLGPSAAWGHPEDVLALAFMIYALRAAWAGRLPTSALLLGVSICFKQWTVVALPFLLLQLPAGTRRRYLVGAAWLPLSLAALCLGVDWSHASRHLLAPTLVPEGIDPGHHAVFARILGADTSRMSRLIELAIAPIAAWRTRHVLDRQGLMIALGLVLLARPLLEPYDFGYYWSPGLLLLALGVAGSKRSLRVDAWGWPVLLTAWVAPGDTSSMGWWSGVVIILAAWAWRTVPRRGLVIAEMGQSIDAVGERSQLPPAEDEIPIASSALDNDSLPGSVLDPGESLEDSAAVTPAKPRGSTWLAPPAHHPQLSNK